MAFDKVIDSAVLDANLTSVADAIRTKGGTSEQLSFPDGFVNAVEGIQVGGGVSEQDLINAMALIQWPSGDIVVNEDRIADYAFSRRNITGVFAPNVAELGQQTFSYCTKLINVEIPKSNTATAVFEGCSALEHIAIPGASYIGTSCFNNCSKLKMIICSASMRKISSRSIQNCYALGTLVFPGTTVVSLDHVNALQNTPFSGYNGLTGTVYCPSALISEYQQATNWSTLYTASTCNFVAIEGSEYE